VSSAEEMKSTEVTVAHLASTDLTTVRQHVERAAAAVGLDDTRADRFILAVSEIAANAIEHGRPPASVTIITGVDRLTVEVSDCGPGFVLPNPLSWRPDPGDGGGRGLWLARLWADNLETSISQDRFTVRLTAVTDG
jgi:anti-sigma regulatory factor (Ser/Thr protein kinase)